MRRNNWNFEKALLPFYDGFSCYKKYENIVKRTSKVYNLLFRSLLFEYKNSTS